MSLAPELFSPEKAVKYLTLVEKVLIVKMYYFICNFQKENSLGVKTLDPKERIYVPWYDNSNDSEDPLVAHGFGYHNVLFLSKLNF